MNTKTLFPFLLALALGAGCSHQVAQAAGNAQTVPTTPAPFATPPVLPGTPDVATLVARVQPVVVNITTVHEIHAPRMEFDVPFEFGPFGGIPGMRQPHNGGGDEVMKQRALGSGFLVDGRGHVVTNAHVVEGADEVKVKLADEREFDATVKGRDPRLDLAVLELKGAKDLPSASLGSSEELRVGEYVVAIGNPFGLGNTVTMGIVSAKSRSIGAGPYDDFIQTDASINPGNSGGPLFNLRGQVVGINTAINPNGKGIGFAIPSDALKDILPQLLGDGHVARGKLGVYIQSVDAPLAKALGLDHPKGALIGEVESGGPGEKAGLKAGDVVVGIDDTEVGHARDLPRLVARHTPGSKVTLKVLRDKSVKTVSVTLDAIKDDTSPSHDSGGPGHGQGLGLGLGDAPGGGALVQSVAPGSPADEGLDAGDVILEVNHVAVAGAAEAVRQIQATPAGQPVLMKVRSHNKTRFVAIERN